MFLLLQRLLPRSLEGRLVLACALLGALLLLAGRQIIRLQDALAAKPKIEIHTVVETKIVERRVAGPVVIHERIVTLPSGEKTVDREITRAAVTTDKGTEIAKTLDRTETPVGLRVRHWSVTGALNPLDYKHGATVGLSRSFGFFTLGYAHTLDKAVKFNDGHRINLGIPLF